MDIGLVVTVIAGYWFLTKAKFTRYGVVRQSGYHLFFNSAFWGIVLFFFGWCLATVWRLSYPEFDAWLERNAPFRNFDAIVVSIIFAVFLPWFLNCFAKPESVRKRISERNLKDHGQLIDWLLQDALESPSLVELSLKGGKSYIGYVTQIEMDTVSDADVGLIPVVSGYQDNDTRRLVITTNYSEIILKCEDEASEFGHLSIEDLEVLIPRKEISLARHFDWGVAEYFGQLESMNPQ